MRKKRIKKANKKKGTEKSELKKVNYEKNVFFEEAIEKLGVIALFYKF